jgi:hypothetical protein
MFFNANTPDPPAEDSLVTPGDSPSSSMVNLYTAKVSHTSTCTDVSH